ncbi:MAG TPA: ATP-binding protein [Gemmatimonadaceae bacterium]|nr:ATP-binding protein [Gemmatimonadaceae bacterium]
MPARQTWRITQQLRETTTILGPARLLVSELQAGLARELGALQGYALSRDRTQLARYRAAADEDDRRLAALEHATPQLGAPPASRLVTARAGIRAWRQLSESLIARQITARELADALETVQARYDAAVEGVAALSEQLAAESVVRDDRVRSLEQFSIVANAVLVLVAFAALAGVAGLTRRERRLAGSLQRSIDEARQRAREEVALREAAEALAGAFTVDEVTQEIVRAALEAMHGSGAFVAQLADVADGSPRRLVVQAGAGEDAPAVASAGSLSGVDVEQVLGGGAPLLIPALDAAEGNDASDLLPHPRGSAIVVPLDGPRLGARALFVLRPPHEGFRPEDVARAAIFGHLATLAYEKVFLLDAANEGRRKLERAMTSRSRLMRGFSHDVKNPIGAADGFAELLSHGVYGDLTTEQQASVERLRRSLRRALSLIDELHELARVETGAIAVTPEPVDIAELVHTIGEEYHAVAEAHGLEFEVVAEPGIPLIATNGARVRQIASNLLSNAIKYTDAGSVRVRARRSSLHAADAPVPNGHGTDGGEWAVIEFADSGPGIPLHQQDFIFEEFSRLNADKPGAGLGLAISELLAQALGGRISVESEPGRGSTFTLWIPLRESSPEP